MKAIILCGGEFKKEMHPLTVDLPKISLPFARRTILELIIVDFVQAGVTHIILAICFDPEILQELITRLSKEYNLSIVCVREDIPLGTAGAIKNVEFMIKQHNTSDYFFVCNSDVVCVFPFKKLLRIQKELSEKKGEENFEAIISLRKATVPSKYGVVITEPKSFQVKEFVEKPTNFINDIVNAGFYLFHNSIFDRIEAGKKTSIERDIFPSMATEGKIYSHMLKGFWFSIKGPFDYLKALSAYLDSNETNLKKGSKSHPNTEIIGNVLIVPT